MSLRLFKSFALTLMLAVTLGVLSSPARGQAGVQPELRAARVQTGQ